MVAKRRRSKAKSCWSTLAKFGATGFTFFALSNAALAIDIAAGPIWSNDDAKAKCPIATQVYNVPWNGQWVTTVSGAMSVCGTNATSLRVISLPANIKAGPIWDDDDAEIKCRVVAAAARGVWDGQWGPTVWGAIAAAARGVWDGQWRPTVWGAMSVCGVNPEPK